MKVSQLIEDITSFKRKSIFDGAANKEIWRKIDISKSNDIEMFPWKTRSREIAERQVMDKYLTVKDMRDAARVHDETEGSSFDKLMAAKEFLNGLLDERSGHKWIKEFAAIQKTLPSEMDYARDEFGEMDIPPEPPKPRLKLVKKK